MSEKIVRPPSSDRERAELRLAEVRREALMRGDLEAAAVYERALCRSAPPERDQTHALVGAIVIVVVALLAVILLLGRLL